MFASPGRRARPARGDRGVCARVGISELVVAIGGKRLIEAISSARWYVTPRPQPAS
jgi:hypothetical protein